MSKVGDFVRSSRVKSYGPYVANIIVGSKYANPISSAYFGGAKVMAKNFPKTYEKMQNPAKLGAGIAYIAMVVDTLHADNTLEGLVDIGTLAAMTADAKTVTNAPSYKSIPKVMKDAAIGIYTASGDLLEKGKPYMAAASGKVGSAYHGTKDFLGKAASTAKTNLSKYGSNIADSVKKTVDKYVRRK